MATNRITYTLDFKANFKDVQGQLNTLKDSLNSIVGMKLTPAAGLAKDIDAASTAAMQLSGYLKNALDPLTGKLDLSRFQTQMKMSGQSASSLASNLVKAGSQGAAAFLNVSNAVVNAQKPMARLGALTSGLVQSLKNVAKWQISTRILTGFTGAISDALTYVKDIDKSLNDIRIVTGASQREMEKFALSANKVAKELSSTTNEIAKATLIYRQQGDSATEALEKAQITIKAANAAGTSAKEMSEYLTGVWNSYQVGAQELELFVDKLAKVGAITATSMEEVSTAMTKVAATANAVGVNYDQLLSTIATVSSATRVSAETVGTAFKTIYARMGDLELKGSIDEDGITTTLGSVSSKLKQVGVDVLDANGNIRDMGNVVEDLGNKWKGMNRNQQTAIAEAVAGKRQYTQLFALFENWDKYKDTVKEAADAQGELNKQHAIFEDSIAAAQNRLKAAKEDFYNEGIGKDLYAGVLNGLADVIEFVDGLTEAAGGLQPIFMALGGYLMSKFAPQISEKVTGVFTSIAATVPGLGKRMSQNFLKEWSAEINKMKEQPLFQSTADQAALDKLEKMVVLKKDLAEQEKKMNSVARETTKIMMEQLQLRQKDANQLRENAKELEKTQNLMMSAVSAKSGIIGKEAIKTQTISKDGFSEILSSFGEVGNNASQALFKDIATAEAPIKKIAENYAQMDATARSLVSRSLAQYFNDGIAPSSTMVSNVQEMLSATNSLNSVEAEILHNNTQEFQMMAAIKSEAEGIFYVYNDLTKEIEKGDSLLKDWESQGVILLQNQKTLKKEAADYAHELENIHTKLEKNASVSNLRSRMTELRTNVEGPATIGATISGLEEEEINQVNNFANAATTGQHISAEMMQNMAPLIERMKGMSGADVGVQNLVKVYEALNTAMTETQEKIDGVQRKYEENAEAIRKVTGGNAELMQLKTGVNEEYVKSIEKHQEEIKKIEEEIERIKELNKEAAKTKAKNALNKEDLVEKPKKGTLKERNKQYKKDTQIANQAKKLVEDFSGSEKDMEKLDELISKIGNNPSLSKVKKALEQFKDELSNTSAKGQKDIEKLKNKLDDLSKNPPKPIKPEVQIPKLNVKGVIEDVSKIGGAMTSLSMNISMLSSSFQTLLNPDTKGIEKLTAVLMLLGTVTSTMNTLSTISTTIQQTSLNQTLMAAIAKKVETKATEGQTKATLAQHAAQLLANSSNPLGWIVLAISAIATLTALIYGLANANSTAAQEQKKFEQESKRYEKLQEEITVIDEEIQSLKDLQGELVEARTNKEKLLEVQTKLNKALGAEIDLVNGGEGAYRYANELMAEKLRIEEEKRAEKVSESTEVATNRLRNITATSSGKGRATETDLSNSDVMKILRKVATFSDEEMEAWSKSNEHKTFSGLSADDEKMSYNMVMNLIDGENGVKQIITDAWGESLESLDFPSFGASLKEIVQEIGSSGEINMIQPFVDKLTELQPQIKEAINKGDTEQIETTLNALEALLPENMKDEWRKNAKDTIQAIENAKGNGGKVDTTRTDMIAGLSDFRNISESSRSAVAEFAEFGQLTTETIESMVQSWTGMDQNLKDLLQEELLDPNLTSEKLQNILQEAILNSIDTENGVIAQALQEGNIDLITKIFKDEGIANAEEFAKSLMNIKQLTVNLASSVSGVKANMKATNQEVKNIVNEVDQLGTELGFSSDEAARLAIEYGFLNENTSGITDDFEAISRMRVFAESAYEAGKLEESSYQTYVWLSKVANLDMSNLTDAQRGIIQGAGITINKDGSLQYKDIIGEDAADFARKLGEKSMSVNEEKEAKIAEVKSSTFKEEQSAREERDSAINDALESRNKTIADAEETYATAIKDAEEELANAIKDAEKALKDATETYQKAMKEFAKKEALEQLQELIMNLNEAFEQFQITLDGIDFEKELGGDSLQFQEKMDLYNEELITLRNQAIEAHQQFEQLSQIEPQDGDQAQELSDQISEVVNKYRSSILEIRSLQEEMSVAGVEAMQKSMTEHSELIDKITESMNKLAELNNSQDQYYSETQEKALLATSIITTGLLQTKDKEKSNEETGQLSARKKENQEIIRESKKMEDMVQKYSKKANELGIKDRQQARAEEKAEIEKEYADAKAEYEKALADANEAYRTALDDAEKEYTDAIANAEKEYVDAIANAEKAYNDSVARLEETSKKQIETISSYYKGLKDEILGVIEAMKEAEAMNGGYESTWNSNKKEFKNSAKQAQGMFVNGMGVGEDFSATVKNIDTKHGKITLDYNGSEIVYDIADKDLENGAKIMVKKGDTVKGGQQLASGVKTFYLKGDGVTENSGIANFTNSTGKKAEAKDKDMGKKGQAEKDAENLDGIKFSQIKVYQSENSGQYTVYASYYDPIEKGIVTFSQGGRALTDVTNILKPGLSPLEVTSTTGNSWVMSSMPTGEQSHLIDVTTNQKIKDALSAMSAYGTGTDATKNELALFGEKDSDGDGKSEELLISPDGKVYLAGTNGPEMIQVKAGTKVFNDKETSKILKSKKDFSQLLTSGGQKAPIKTYGDGTSNFSSINENNNEIFADLNKATDKGIQDMNETFDKGFSEMLDTQSEYNQKQFKAQEETNSKLKTEQLENFEDRIDNLENYNKDTQKEVSSNNQKIESSVSGHLAKVNNNINLATSTMSGNVNSAATAMTEYINQMQFTLPGIDGEAFIESIGTILEQAREATGLPRKAQTSGTSPTGDGDADGEWLKKDNEVKTASEGVHEAYKSFIEAGMTDTGAKTLIANLQGESGFNLNPNALGDGGNSHGIAQWNNAAGRWQPVVNFLGDKAFTRAGQLEYLNYDLKNNYPNIWKMLTTKGFSPEEIMDALVRQYEKPENQNDAIKTRLNHLKQLDDSVFLYADDMNLWEIIEYVQARHRGESPFGNGDWIDPIIGGNKISSGGMFGVDRGDHKHGGVDIGAASNTPIYAPRSGTVIINAYQEAGAGNYIRLDHGDGYQTTFMHMIKPSELKVGSSVSQGDIIGYVGNTGRSYGAHLHYEVSLNGKRVDPREFLQAYAKGGITSNERALVGEYGREIILYPDGTAGLLGENGIEYADLPAGARIIPSQETEKILNNPKDYRENINPILGFAQGTAKEYLTLTDIPWDILKKVLTYIHSQGGEYAFEVDPSTLTEFKNTADFSKKVTAFKRNKVGETANLNDLIDFVENVFAEAATPGSEESLEKATDATKEAIKVQQTLTKAIDRACIEITDPLTTLYTAMKDLGFVFSDTSQWTDALKDALLQYSEHSSNKREIQNMLKALKEGEVPTNRFLEMTATMLKLDSEALVSTAKERKKGLAQKADGSYYLFDKGENPLVQKDSIDKELSYLDMKGVLSNLDAAADLESAYESKRMAASLNQNPNSQLYRLKTDKGYKYYITDDIVTLDWYSGGVDTSKLEQMNKEYLFENLKAQNFQYMDANDATWEYNSKRQAAYYDKDQIQGYNMETGQIDPNKDKYVLVQVDSLKEDNKWGIDNYSLMKANYNDEQMKAIFGTNAVRLSDAEKRSALLNFDTQKLWNNTMTWTAKQFIWDNTIKDEATGQFKAKPGTVFYVKEDPNNLANSQVYAVDKDHPLASYGITPEQEKNEFKILDSQSVDELASGLLVSDVRLKEMLDYYLNPQLAPGNNQAEANDPLAKYRDFLTLEEGGIISHNKASFERIQEHWDSEWIREQNKKNYKENIEFYKKYPLMTEEQQMEQLYERQRKTNSAEMARYSRMLDETLAIYNDYMDKISSGEITEADVEYLSALEETIQTASDEIDKISQNMIDATEKQKTWADNQSAFTIMRNDAFNLWTESNSKVNLALEDLQKTIQDFPEDIDRFYEKFNVLKTSVASEMSEWLSAYQTYVNKLIEGINDDVTRLTALKTVQEQFNAELNKYRDVQYQINKQLTESKMNAMWLDEKTKQNIFNEKSYLAIAEKIAEVREEARDDYHDYLYDINHLEDDELYRANILTEEYKERAAIREKELAILQEEINLQAKQNVLNEALMERNVRVFSGGRWRQIANIQNVIKAQQDLDETKYKIETKQIELDQQNDLNTNYNQPLRENNEEIGRLNELLTQAQEYVTENTDALNGVKKVTSESIDSFKKKVDAQMKHMGALEDEIARYNVNSKEEFTRNSVLGLASEALAAWARGDMDAVADNKIQMEAYGASELARFFDTANPDTSYDKALEAVNAWRNYRNLPEFDLPSYAATTAASRSEADNMTLINDALTGLFKLKVMAEKTSDTDTFNRANLLATNIREYLKVLKYSGDDYSGMTADAMKQDILSKGKYSLGNGTIEDVFSTIVKGMFSNTDTNLFGQKSVSLISGDNRGIFSDAFSQKIGLDYIHNVGTSARSEVSTSLALRSLKGEPLDKQNTIAKLFTDLYALKNHFDENGYKSGYSDLFSSDVSEMSEQIRQMIGVILFGDASKGLSIGADMNAEEFLATFGDFINPEKKKLTSKDRDSVLDIGEEVVRDIRSDIPQDTSDIEFYAWRSLYKAKHGWHAIAGKDGVSEQDLQSFVDKADYAREILLSTGKYTEEQLSGMKIEEVKEKLQNDYELTDAEIENLQETAIDTIQNELVKTVEDYSNMMTTAKETLEQIQAVFAASSSVAAQDFATVIESILENLKAKMDALDRKEQELNSRSTTITVPQSNARGTRNAHAGLSWVNEQGIEMLATNEGQLIELNPHEKIFNNDQLNFLYDLSKQKIGGMKQAVSSITSNNNNSISIADLNISLDNVTDAQSFIDELRGLTSYIRNTKTIYGNSR